MPTGVDLTPAQWDAELLVFQGDSRAELRQRLDQVRAQCDSAGSIDLLQLAWSLNRGRIEAPHRIAVVASTADELKSLLERASERLADESCRSIRDVRGIYYFSEPLHARGKVAFLFPGEGAQYVGMLDGLADHFPIVREVLRTCDVQAAEFNPDERPVSRFTLAEHRWPEAAIDDLRRDLNRIDNAFFSVFTANWAIFAMLEQLGVKPDAVAGHSGGELAALVAAGAFDAKRHLGAVSGTMQQLLGHDQLGCALLAVGAPRDVLEDVIATALSDEAEAHAAVAMDNCPHQTIAVGEAGAIARVKAEASGRGLYCEALDLGRPYHTQWFDPYMPPLREMFGNIAFESLDLTAYSCTTGEQFPDDPGAMRDLLLEGWRTTVEFTRLVRNLYRDGVRIFVEVGPRNNLTSFVSDILRGESFLAVPSNVPHKSALAQMHHLAAELIAHHVPVNLDCLYRRRVAELAGEAPADNERREGVAPSAAPGPAASVIAPLSPALPVEQAEGREARAARRPPGALVRNHLTLSEQFLDVQSAVMRQFLQTRGKIPRRRSSRGGPRAVTQSNASGPSTSTDTPLPLLGDVMKYVPAQRLQTRRVLDPREDVYATHHTLGGRSISKVDPAQHGLPVMPMTFTLELMMEAAAKLLPHLRPLSLQNVRLSRWLAFYDDDPSEIEITATVREGDPVDAPATATRQVLVEVKELGRRSQQHAGSAAIAAVGAVSLGPSYPPAPARDAFPMTNERPCKTDVPTTYNNLFHGELLQGFEAVERFGDDGIEGAIRTLPREQLLRSNPDPRFVADPVLLDVSMHPVVAWHLEQADQAGRIMLPFELGRLELYGPMPPVGARFCSRTKIVEGTHWHYTHDIDLFDESDRVWGRISRVKLWRFYLPFHDVNFHGPKDIYFLSDEWPAATPADEDGLSGDAARSCCVKLNEMKDLQHPGLLLAAARVILSPAELAEFLELQGSPVETAKWLFGRAAAKDAVRILQRKRADERPFMADVEIFDDKEGRLYAQPRGGQRHADYPQVAVSHASGCIAAVASVATYVGIDVERTADLAAALDGPAAISRDEFRILHDLDEPSAWSGRVACAKRAAAQALGIDPESAASRLAVRSCESTSGIVELELDSRLAARFPDLAGALLRVATTCDDQLTAAVICHTAPATPAATSSSIAVSDAYSV